MKAHHLMAAILVVGLATGTALGQANGWADDGSVVSLTDSTDNVGIGTSSPESKLTVDPGPVGATSIGGRSINYGINHLSTSGRTGFLSRVVNSFTADDDNAGFQFLYPYATGGNAAHKMFRGAVGSTLADVFFVRQDGSAYFAGNV